MIKTMNIAINIIAFKIGWASTIFGAANDMPWLGPLVVLIAIFVHLHRAAYPAEEVRLLLLAGLIGGCWDSIMVAAGWLSYANGQIAPGTAPVWIVGMWTLFATTLNLSFRWLRSKLVLAAVLGGIFGPLSYYLGAKLGAVELLQFETALIALGLAWAILMPALVVLAERFDGYPVADAAPAGVQG